MTLLLVEARRTRRHTTGGSGGGRGGGGLGRGLALIAVATLLIGAPCLTWQTRHHHPIWPAAVAVLAATTLLAMALLTRHTRTTLTLLTLTLLTTITTWHYHPHLAWLTTLPLTLTLTPLTRPTRTHSNTR